VGKEAMEAAMEVRAVMAEGMADMEDMEVDPVDPVDTVVVPADMVMDTAVVMMAVMEVMVDITVVMVVITVAMEVSGAIMVDRVDLVAIMEALMLIPDQLVMCSRNHKKLPMVWSILGTTMMILNLKMTMTLKKRINTYLHLLLKLPRVKVTGEDRLNKAPSSNSSSEVNGSNSSSEVNPSSSSEVNSSNSLEVNPSNLEVNSSKEATTPSPSGEAIIKEWAMRVHSRYRGREV